MIPLKLTIQNFICYGDNLPSLDLSNIHVACLCGSNGHGKSALLDAITWSLWGNARGKSQDDLIHFGKEEMYVELEFLLNDTKYRVTRRHSRSGSRGRKGTTDLQLQVEHEDTYQPITGNTIRETQSKITNVIGMEYETFINSAFLIQGRADEFTNKSPGERKEVLANILSLGIYDRLQERSRKLGREKEAEANSLKATISFMEEAVYRKDEYKQSLTELDVNLKHMSEHLESKVEHLNSLKVGFQALEENSKELEEIGSKLPILERDIEHFNVEINDRSSRVHSYYTTLEARSEIEDGFVRLKEIQSQYAALNKANTKHMELLKQMEPISKLISQKETRLEEQIYSLNQRLEKELQPRIDVKADYKIQLSKTIQELEGHNPIENELMKSRTNLNELTNQTIALKSDQERLQVEGQELRSKHTLLQHSTQNITCPLCDSSLGEEASIRLSDNYQNLIYQKAEFYKNNEKKLNKVLSERDHLDKDVTKRETKLQRDKQDLQSKISQLEHHLKDCSRASEEAATTLVQLESLENALKNKSYAESESKSLEELQTELATISYSPELHEELYSELQRLETYSEKSKYLIEATQRLPQEEESLKRIQEMADRRRDDLKQSKARLSQRSLDTNKLAESKNNISAAELEIGKIQAEQQELFSQKGALESNLQKTTEMENDITIQQKKVMDLQKDQAIYQELSEAFSRNGIQAMLIESVLPNIEEEANELLNRMSDGRMNIKLETQRQLRSRKDQYAETLEIKISDELGPRSYEMFSGGEAFRINLALRIALSKVLAQRSGASLPTLFIDEGFGTQDASGRERMIDVIRAIEDDFQKIIVITHLDDIREAFPVRIEVNKTDLGSTYRIV